MTTIKITSLTEKLFLILSLLLLAGCNTLRGTGDLGVIIERATGKVQVFDSSNNSSLASIDGLGDLSHASVVFSRDERYAYVFGRDGGLSKVDILAMKIEKRVIQSGNSIGGAISQDGKLVAVSNYTPGGVKVFNAETLELVADLPAVYGEGKQSKVIGLVDAPGNLFVYSLYDAGEIWIADFSRGNRPAIRKFTNIGKLPYDALISGDGRYYIAGLFGEDGLALLDLWNIDTGVKKILSGYGRGEQQLPVYKMPHLEGWAMAGNYAFLPAIGHHKVLVVNRDNWKQVKSIPVHGQPVFVMARPDGRHIWVNFAFPLNDTIEVIDTATLKVIRSFKPGKAVLHMEFSPRGEQVWVSVRDENRVDIYDTHTFEKKGSLVADKPSGIFMAARAHRLGL